MRISTDRYDAGHKLYRALPNGCVVNVYCNGLLLDDCVTVDTKRRVAVVAAKDDDWFVVNRRKGRIKLKQVVGEMRIEILGRPQ